MPKYATEENGGGAARQSRQRPAPIPAGRRPPQRSQTGECGRASTRWHSEQSSTSPSQAPKSASHFPQRGGRSTSSRRPTPCRSAPLTRRLIRPDRRSRDRAPRRPVCVSGQVSATSTDGCVGVEGPGARAPVFTSFATPAACAAEAPCSLHTEGGHTEGGHTEGGHIEGGHTEEGHACGGDGIAVAAATSSVLMASIIPYLLAIGASLCTREPLWAIVDVDRYNASRWRMHSC
jgi:hypothetical protein